MGSSYVFGTGTLELLVQQPTLQLMMVQSLGLEPSPGSIVDNAEDHQLKSLIIGVSQNHGQPFEYTVYIRIF
jgi:hypothetical protein